MPGKPRDWAEGPSGRGGKGDGEEALRAAPPASPPMVGSTAPPLGQVNHGATTLTLRGEDWRSGVKERKKFIILYYVP